MHFFSISNTRDRAAFLPAWVSVLSIYLVLFCLPFIGGCGGGGGGGGSSSSGASVTGTVQDSTNGDAAVVGAKVVIGGGSATTDSTGAFSITNAAVGATTATITVSGGSPLTVGFTPSLAKGANPALALFINIGEIGGKVLLPTGGPAVGAFVSNSVDGDSLSTASDGSFLFTEVPIGATTLNFVLGTASATMSVNVVNGLTTISPVTLVESTNTNPPAAPYDITGQVVLGDLTNGAVAGTQVFLLLNGNQLESTTTDANGDYSFYVPVGSYTLQFARSSYVTGNATVSVTKPSTPVTVATVTLQPQ